MPRQVLIGSIKQETNGFNRHTTPLAAFERQGINIGEQIFAAYENANLEIGGFIQVAREEGWTIIPSVASFAPPAGPVEDEAFEHILGILIERIRAASPLDGVLLALHGSMVTVSHEDAELEIVRRVREAIGPDVLLMTSLDPHCNISQAMAEVVDGMFAFRTSPHIDQRKTGVTTARMMAEAFKRGTRPEVVLERRPMLIGFDGARTYHSYGPMLEAISLAATHEKDPDILPISIHAGYSKADCSMVGPSAAVTGFAPKSRLQEIASAMMDECWRTRETTSERIVSVEEAMAAVKAHKDGDAPVVLGDYGDSPGGGGYGDGTALLSALMESGVGNAVLTPIFDPEAVDQALSAGVGNRVTISIGGRNAPQQGGGPVTADWLVKTISDGRFVYTGPYGTGTTGTFGPSVVLESGGVQVIVTSIHKGIYDQEQLRIYGIEPRDMAVIVVKSMQGYRGDFQGIASVCLDVDSGGITSPDPAKFDWKRIPRPIWPLDPLRP
ncbi:M81 family metallopeptidase [Tianweitania sediminis]|uniref:Microcystinase C n=1 Tax=Tianweitania sediminis TaxID=1502156 RepID=A0A8J7UM65_9HYPH|nr:M81 family metallopeptidase [Tianweitania sediminis]MBP0440032.1 M81 family metallopeptidase [Tianweitania sediminis]